MSLLTSLALARPATAAAASCTPSRLLIVLDKSSSMNGGAGSVSKWTAARGAIDQLTAAYESSIELGLATFPHPDACGPGQIAVSPALDRGDAIHAALMAPPPEVGAYTPLGETLRALAQTPAVLTTGGASHVVVITDGYQWCSPYDPDTRRLPVDGVEALAAHGVTTFVVGFGAGVDVPTLDEMALVAGTARAGCNPFASADDPTARCYYQADDAGGLLAALMDIAAVASDETCDDVDNDCDGLVDEGACPTVGTDAGVASASDAGDGGVVAAGGCGCRSASTSSLPAGLALALLVLPLLVLSRRRPAPATTAAAAARRAARQAPRDPEHR